MSLVYFCHLSKRAKWILAKPGLLFSAVSVVYVEAENRIKPIYEVKTSERSWPSLLISAGNDHPYSGA